MEGVVVNDTPLRVGRGGGRGDEPLGSVDNPVLTMRFGGRMVPVIPGSTWKGALRSEAERYVRAVERPQWGQFWRACDIFEVTNDEEKRKREEEDPCVVCSLFGNTGLAAHLRFFDSYPLGTYSMETVTRVAIERLLGGQSPGKLFKVQLVSPGTRWKFRMVAINLDLEGEGPSQELARYVVSRLVDGIQVGGGKSVGNGLVRLIWEELRVRRVSVEGGELRTTELSKEEIRRIVGVGGG